MSGGIQNLLQAQVPVPQGQLGSQQQLPQQTPQSMYQQQQQLHQQKLQQEQMRHQQLQMQQQQQQIRLQQLQQQQQQQQQTTSFEPPQQIVGLANRPPHPGQYTAPPMGMRPMGQMQQMMNQVSSPNMIRHQMVGMPVGARMPVHPNGVGVTGGLRLNIPPQQAMQQMGSGNRSS